MPPGGRANRQSASTRRSSPSWRAWRRACGTVVRRSSQVGLPARGGGILGLPWEPAAETSWGLEGQGGWPWKRLHPERQRWAGWPEARGWDASPCPPPPDLMIEMEDQTNDVHEAGIPVLDYKTYTDRVFFLPSKDGDKDVMITGRLDIPESRRPVVEQALYQFSNLLNSKSFLVTVSGARAAGQGRGGRGGGQPEPRLLARAGAKVLRRSLAGGSRSSSTPWRASGSSQPAPRSISRPC